MNRRDRSALAVYGVLVLVVAALLTITDRADAAPVRPDSRPCVSVWEYRHLRDGLTVREAAKWLDGPGVRGPGRSLHYKACGRPWDKARVIVRLRDHKIAGAYMIVVESGSLL